MLGRINLSDVCSCWFGGLKFWLVFYLSRSSSGALELWELAEDERLLVNRFTKHEHDHIVTTVSPTGATGAVTGSMDCRLDSCALLSRGNVSMNSELGRFDVMMSLLLQQLQLRVSSIQPAR